MAALVIPNSTTFGSLTNQMVSRMVSLNSTVPRLQEAIATASSGYTGTPGTEFEAPSMGDGTNLPPPPNNFMVQPDPAALGAQGTAYAYAVGQLQTAWAAFWTEASPYIEQLDNGMMSF